MASDDVINSINEIIKALNEAAGKLSSVIDQLAEMEETDDDFPDGTVTKSTREVWGIRDRAETNEGTDRANVYRGPKLLRIAVKPYHKSQVDERN